MAMEVILHPSDEVEVAFKGKTLRTRQDGSLPAPFDLFLASIAACGGYYVSRFCTERGIPVEGVRLEQHTEVDPETRMVRRIALTIHLPAEFPERYRAAVVRAAELCTVKKHLERPPAVDVEAVSAPVTAREAAP